MGLNGSSNNQIVVDGVGSALNLAGVNPGVSLGSGNGAQGTLTVSNGGHLTIDSTGTGTAAGFTVGGRTSTGSGKMVVSGVGSQVLISGDSTSNLFPGFTVGRGGLGDLQVLGGGKIIVTNNSSGTGGFNVGGIAGTAGNGFPVGNGTIAVSGPGSTLDIQAIHGNFDIGSRSGGVGTVSVNGGGFLHAEQGTIGLTAGSVGTLTISGSGSSVVLNGDDGAGRGAILRVGASGQGTLNILNGSQLRVSSTSSFGGLVAGGNSAQTGGVGTINVSAGSILINGGTSSRLSLGGGAGGDAALNITSGGQVFVAPTPGSGGGVYISREAGSSGSATVSGFGSLLSAGDFLGIGVASDRVSNSGIGTLTLQGGGTASATNIRVGSQGSILGVGSLVGNVTDAGGIIAPGLGSSTFGQIGINGNLTLLSGKLNLDIGGTAPQSHDGLQIAGSVNLSGGTINIGFSNGYLPHAGDQIQLVTASGGFTGSFNPAITFSQTPSLPYTYSNGTLSFLSPAPSLVPPQTVFLDFGPNSNALFSIDVAGHPSIAINYNKSDSGLGISDITSIVNTVAGIYSGYNVNFLTIPPASGPYHTVYIGDTLASINLNPSLASLFTNKTGIARNINIGNSNPQDSSVVFSGLGGFYTVCFSLTLLCPNDSLIAQVIAHETGHLLGLFHVDDRL